MLNSKEIELLCLPNNLIENFGISIDNLKEAVLPKSWLSIGLHQNDIMLSMEKALGKKDFVWEEHDDPSDGTLGIAYKEIRINVYIFIVVSENDLAVMYLSKEMKDSLYDF